MQNASPDEAIAQLDERMTRHSHHSLAFCSMRGRKDPFREVDCR